MLNVINLTAIQDRDETCFAFIDKRRQGRNYETCIIAFIKDKTRISQGLCIALVLVKLKLPSSSQSCCLSQVGGVAVGGREGGLAGEQQQQCRAHHPAAVDVAVVIVVVVFI